MHKYGRQNIAQIITFGTLAARAVIRAVGRALNYEYGIYDKIAKMIPKEIGITIPESLKVNQDLLKLYQTDDKVKRLIDTAIKLEGLPTSTSTHAAGVLITGDGKGGGEVTDYVPIWQNESGIVAQYDKNLLEDLGLLKMDFLGLKTLGVLGMAKEFIERNHDVEIDFDELYKIPTLDPLKIIRDGNTAGVFQLEGAGMTAFMKDLQPQTIEDIIAGISLYRPGPMGEISRFLYNKRNPQTIRYPLNGDTRAILEETYGVLTYQEQCMRTVIAIAGYDKSDSDGFRKVIAKKIASKMPLHRKWFVYGRKEKDVDEYGKERTYKPIPGGIAMGYREEELNQFFDLMVDFGKYAFNKSHGAAYAFVAYVTAWFMFYYPTEFMAALLNFASSNRPKVAKYIAYCKKVLNIEISEPDINKSTHEFVPLKDGVIIYTLAIKGATSDVLRRIVEERDTNGEYVSLMDFIVRTRAFLDKGTYEGLIGAGAFNCFGVVKSQHLAALDDFWDGAFKKTKDAEKRAITKNKPFDFEEQLLSRLDGLLPEIKEYPEDISLRIEKSLLGLYLTNNPLFKYAYTIKTTANFSLEDIEYEVDEETGSIMMSNSSVRDRQRVKFVAILNDIIEITTKKKTLMCRLEIEDLTGVASALIWPGDYDKLKPKLSAELIYMFEGYLQLSDDEPPTLIISSAEKMDDVVAERVVYRADSVADAQAIIEEIKTNSFIRGLTPIYIIYNGLKVLLNKEFWVNTSYIEGKYKNKIEIKYW